MPASKKHIPLKKNGWRHAILTEQDRIHLKSKQLDPKTLAKLYAKMRVLLPELKQDLKVISRSKHLQVWLAMNPDLMPVYASPFHESGMFDDALAPTFRPVFPYRVRVVKKDGKRLYWLDMSRKASFFTDRLLDTKYALEKIRVEDDKPLLDKALRLGLLPTRKDDAKTLERIMQGPV